MLDPVGGDHFVDSLRVLRAGGRPVVVGLVGEPIPAAKASALLLKQHRRSRRRLGPYTRSRPGGDELIGAARAELAQSGHVRPLVGERFRLEEEAGAALIALTAASARQDRARGLTAQHELQRIDRHGAAAQQPRVDAAPRGAPGLRAAGAGREDRGVEAGVRLRDRRRPLWFQLIWSSTVAAGAPCGDTGRSPPPSRSTAETTGVANEASEGRGHH